MSHDSCRYITTAIDYVNAPPHVGHAYEKVATDALARYYRLAYGRENVFFLTGTDEHGSKIQKTATEKGISPQAHTDAVSQQFKDTWALMNLDYNRFVRTTDPAHYALVTELWQRMLAKGDLYKASYTGYYCTGCENFLTPKDLNDAGECPLHHTPPQAVEEENWFFRLSRYKEQLVKLISGQDETRPNFVLPEFRRAEVLHILDDLHDISVSRPLSTVSWGIPVPDDADQRIYVWIDALSNYLTGIGWLDNPKQAQRFWPATYHIVGKDILRFHAIYWPAMLLSADIPVPCHVFGHGFINVNDAKMSKSIGNVVAPADVMTRFSLAQPDALRYFFLRTAPFGQDGNFTEDLFKTTVNADLANNLGNLLNRTLTMLNKYCQGRVPEPSSLARSFLAHTSLVEQTQAYYEQLAFSQAIETVLTQVDHANALIAQQQPWALAKAGEQAQLEAVLWAALECLRQVGLQLSPITPNFSAELLTQLGYPSNVLDAATWQDILSAPIVAGTQTAMGAPLLLRLDSDIVGATAKKGRAE